MITKMSKTRARFLALAVMFLAMFTAVLPTYAGGNITTKNYWDNIADQLVSKPGGVSSADDLAQKLSIVAGKSTFNDSGNVKAVIMVLGTSSFIGGEKQLASAGTLGYTAIDVKTVNSSGGTAISGVKVYYYTSSDSASQSKVQANISAGLLNQAGVTPDTGTAMGLLAGVMPMINTLLGLIVVVISIGMTVFSALDIIYLAFPAFRGKIDAQVEGGSNGTKKNKDGSTSSKWVTDDARITIKETLEDGLQPWGPYFKRRVFAYIFLAIILFILLTGNIFAITTLVTDALQGLFTSLHIG